MHIPGTCAPLRRRVNTSVIAVIRPAIAIAAKTATTGVSQYLPTQPPKLRATRTSAPPTWPHQAATRYTAAQRAAPMTMRSVEGPAAAIQRVTAAAGNVSRSGRRWCAISIAQTVKAHDMTNGRYPTAIQRSRCSTTIDDKEERRFIPRSLSPATNVDKSLFAGRSRICGQLAGCGQPVVCAGPVASGDFRGYDVAENASTIRDRRRENRSGYTKRLSWSCPSHRSTAPST